MSNSAFTVGGGSSTGTVTSIGAGNGLAANPSPIVSSGSLSVIINSFCQGRLSLTNGVPLDNNPVVNATVIYFVPFRGNYITLYTGGAWVGYYFTQLTYNVPNVANQMYDLFVYDNSGTLTLVEQAWTDDENRAIDLTLLDGVYVLTGEPNKRYLGSFRTQTAGTVTLSALVAHLWNYYNRCDTALNFVMGTASWTYNTPVYRQANNDPTAQLDLICGLSEDMILATLLTMSSNTSAFGNAGVCIGRNSTTVNGSYFDAALSAPPGDVILQTNIFNNFILPGRNVMTWLERAGATGVTTFFGTGNLNGVAYESSLYATFPM